MKHDQPQRASRGLGIVDRFMRRVVMRRLRGLCRGAIRLEDAVGAEALGSAAGPRAIVRVRDPRFYRRVVLGGELGAAESFIRGDWDCDDLTALFRLFVQDAAASDRLARGAPWMARAVHRLVHRRRANTRAGGRRNVRAHYDLGNDFFGAWLDDTGAYSCGIFDTPDATLREASIEKFDRACRKLDLRPGDHLLEIGTGWGGLAIHAAGHYGCRVTTTTISNEQFASARARIAAAGLADRVSVLNRDYRDLSGQYDKLVSIEMIEAVGHEYLDTFFRKCGELLKPTGSLLLQAILLPERRYRRYLRSVDFIRRYVFPGGCLPSLAAILESVGRASRLRFVHAEDFAPHYAATLRHWRETFRARRGDIRRLGYSEELCRLWDYYLCYCEAGFEERHVGIVQLQFDNFACRQDPLGIGRRAVLAEPSLRPTTAAVDRRNNLPAAALTGEIEP